MLPNVILNKRHTESKRDFVFYLTIFFTANRIQCNLTMDHILVAQKTKMLTKLRKIVNTYLMCYLYLVGMLDSVRPFIQYPNYNILYIIKRLKIKRETYLEV